MTTSAETLRPDRFVLTRDQVAAALALAGLALSSRSGLEPTPPPADPTSALAGAGVLDAGGALRPEARGVLRVVADPHRMLTAVTNRAGDRAWTEATFVHGAGNGGPVAVQSIREQEVDLAFLPTPAQALVTLDELLGVSDLTARPGDGAVRLDLAGYAALLATADLLHEERLEAQLARERRPIPAITLAAVERQLDRGLASNDTRWAVTAARAVCPSNLGEVRAGLAAGLDVLVQAGLLARNGDRLSPTDAGLELCIDLAEIVNSAGLILATVDGNERAALAHVTLFRCARAIWFAGWRSVSAARGEIDLFQSSAVAALGVLDGLLSPAALPEAE